MEIKEAEEIVSIQSHGFHIVACEVLVAGIAVVILGVKIPVGRHAMKNLWIFNPSAFVDINVSRHLAMRAFWPESISKQKMRNPNSQALDIKAAGLNLLDEGGASAIFGVDLPPILSFEIRSAQSINALPSVLDEHRLMVAIRPDMDLYTRHGTLQYKRRELVAVL
jgi:hypothetical protein